MSTDLQGLIAAVAAGLSASVAAVALAGAFRAGVLRRVRLGAFEIESNDAEAQQIRESLTKASESSGRDIPFEIEQLANYYSQILAQSKVSFWFSLIFASLGFAVIVAAAFFFQGGSTGATAVQFTAGVIMDAVAGLFFVQSRNAQKSMAEFFDKLRNDRAQVESRNLCEAIESTSARDALRVHLALYYAGVEEHDGIAKNITGTTLEQSV